MTAPSKAEELAKRVHEDGGTYHDILAALREYGALVRARDAEIADGMVGGICEDESHGGSSHDACAIQCAAAISREPLP